MMARRPISRYDLPGGVETQTEPGSRGRVLRNRQGITRKRDMDQAEYEALLREQERWLNVVTPETRFTARTLCRMHEAWLGEIYEWAGRYRSVDVSKGGFTWPPAARVVENMAAFEKGLLARQTPCRPDALQNVAGRMAEVHAELLLIHPFREGNGRLARWLADLMALQAGFPAPGIRFAGRGGAQEQARYLSSVKQGYLMRYDALAGFFLEAMERRLGAGD